MTSITASFVPSGRLADRTGVQWRHEHRCRRSRLGHHRSHGRRGLPHRLPRRERGRRARRAPPLRRVRDLPDHPGLDHGRARRRLERRRARRTSGARCPRSSRCSPRAVPLRRCTARCRRARSRRRSPRRQGLLLMIPTMFKVAGELTPTVLHVAARAVATHALLIFGDHSDVMAVRSTGWAMLVRVRRPGGARLRARRARRHAARRACRSCTSSTASAPRTRWRRSACSTTTTCAPSSGRRTSSRTAPTASPPRRRSCGAARRTPTSSSSRARPPTPTTTPCPATVAEVMAELGERIGRDYQPRRLPRPPRGRPRRRRDGLGHRHAARDRRRAGAPRARRSASRSSGSTVPSPSDALRAALPATVTRIAVLDRTKEPGAPAEPLHLDVMSAFSGEAGTTIIGGRYGLGSKEFTPARREGRLRRARRAASRGTGSQSASSTTSPTSRSTSTPTSRADPRRAGDVLRPRQRRHGRREQDLASSSSASTPTCTRRATSSTTRRSPAR